jgi:hypothetical protein
MQEFSAILKLDYSIYLFFIFNLHYLGAWVELGIIVLAIFIGGDCYLICFDIFIPIAEVPAKMVSVI